MFRPLLRQIDSRTFRSRYLRITDAVLTIAALAALLALATIGYHTTKEIKTADIKVPIALTKPEYRPGEDVYGIFFGEVYYNGEFQILREVYCPDYKAVISDEDDDLNNLYEGQSFPHKLDGTVARIGKLPNDLPDGNVNCIIAFTNIYTPSVPFGERRITKTYYTQQMTIKTDPAPSVEESREPKSRQAPNVTGEDIFPPAPRQQTTTPPVGPSANVPQSNPAQKQEEAVSRQQESTLQRILPDPLVNVLKSTKEAIWQ